MLVQAVLLLFHSAFFFHFVSCIKKSDFQSEPPPPCLPPRSRFARSASEEMVSEDKTQKEESDPRQKKSQKKQVKMRDLEDESQMSKSIFVKNGQKGPDPTETSDVDIDPFDPAQLPLPSKTPPLMTPTSK